MTAMLGFAGTCLVLCVVASLTGNANCEKVLLIPNAAYSVCRPVVIIGQELIKKGHDVAVYLMEGMDKVCPVSNGMRTITYKAPPFNIDERMAQFQELMARGSVLNPWAKTFLSIYALGKNQARICQTSLSDHVAIQKLREENFDFILIDGSVQNSCFGVIPYMLNVTYGSYGDSLFTWPGIRPFLPHKEPTFFSPCTDAMSLAEMALNSMALLYQYFCFLYNLPMQYVNELAPELTRMKTIELLSSASVYLINDQSFLGYVDPQSSKVIQIGGIAIKQPKPLPAEFEDFLNKSTTKAVVFAFGGSSFTTIPGEFQEKFERALTEVNVPVIWKDKVNLTRGNILKRSWLPINDILAHPNVGLLVYHCGKNGIYEAVYHGIPILCFPVMYDHPHFGARVEKLGIGKILELATFTSDQLKDTITELLTNPSYKANAVKLSEIFRSLPQASSEKAGYWVDHVIKHGGNHLQTAAQPSTVYVVLTACGLIYVFVHIFIFCCCKCFKKTSQICSKKRIKKD